MSLAGEMVRKHHTTIGYRFRRFQALDDTLTVYFHMYDNRGWYTTADVCEFMEWDANNRSTMRRVRRILQALERVGKMEHKGTLEHGTVYFWRAIRDIGNACHYHR